MPSTPTSAVEAALDHIVAEYRTQDDWARELIAEHAAARRRLAILTETWVKLATTLPQAARRRHVAALEALLPPLPLRRLGPRTALTRTIETFLALHQHTVFRARDLHAWLEGQGTGISRAYCASELSRRVKNGVVERVGRGRYGVCTP